MTWPFENDTGAIVKKLAKRSLASEKRRNLMVVVVVALAAFLVCLSAVLSVSIAQIQRNQVADTYEAVFTGVEEDHVAALKDLPEFARVGEYYLLVHGIRLGSQTDQNSCEHLTAGGNAFFHRSGKGTQQKETPETKSRIYGICKLLARP